MKHIKAIVSTIFLCLIVNVSFAQKARVVEIESFSTDIFDILNKLNNQIESFFDKEKADKLNRNLQYFKNDLNEYLLARKSLMDMLESNNYNVESEVVVKNVPILKKKLEKLTSRIWHLEPYVSSTLSEEAESLVRNIHHNANSNNRVYLTKLEELIHGQEVDKQLLRKNGEEIYDQLVKSVGLVTTIQIKLQKKFNLK